MQPINKHNYEAYFLDFLEGNLTEVQEQALHLFLDKHPDLKAEFEETKLFYLEDSTTTVFNSKDKLYRNEETALFRKEHLCIAAAEGVLTAEEQIELDVLLQDETDLLAELAYFQKTRLSAPSIAFPDKEDLKRKALPLISWKTYTSAAAAAVLAIFLMNSQQAEKSYTPQSLSLQSPTESLDETDLLSAELPIRENIDEFQSQQQSSKQDSQVQRQKGIEDQLAERASVKLKTMEPMPLQEISRKPRLDQMAQKAKISEDKPPFFDQTVKEELPTAMEFAKSLVKKEVMKNKTLAELLLAEAEKFGEEKLKVKVKKEEREAEKYIAINIGNFSFSRSK